MCYGNNRFISCSKDQVIRGGCVGFSKKRALIRGGCVGLSKKRAHFA